MLEPMKPKLMAIADGFLFVENAGKRPFYVHVVGEVRPEHRMQLDPGASIRWTGPLELTDSAIEK